MTVSSDSTEMQDIEELDWTQLLDEYDYARPQRGELRDGVVMQIEDNGVLVSIGTKREGVIPQQDLRQMGDFTLDVAWEEIKFSRQHAGDFRRIAVLTEDQWLTWSAWVSQLFVTAEVKVFDDEDEARAWLAAETTAETTGSAQ